MPDAGEVEAIHNLQKTLEQVGAALGAPMLAKIAHVDGEADAAKAVASRVMRTYEAATESLATPWEHQAPPVVTTGETLAAAPAESQPTATPTGMGGIPGGIGPINIAPVKTDYRGRAVMPTTVPSGQPVPATPVTTAQPSAAVPLSPAAMARGGQPSGEEHAPQFSPIGAPAADSDLGLNAGMQVAPAVLGGLDPSAQRVPTDTAIAATGTDAEASRGTESGTAQEAAT